MDAILSCGKRQKRGFLSILLYFWRLELSCEERKGLITKLEGIRKSKVLCYVLSDRESSPPGIVSGLSTSLGTEPQIFFIDQLRRIGKVTKLDLFLYTRGGATDSVWPLINLLREHCEHLTVIVPFKAHSGGTLICLGADEIIMTDFAELSPIDPTTGNQFNPIEQQGKSRLGISVEDVTAYFKLSKDLAGIQEEANRLEVFKQLTCNGPNALHPLALGNVQRVYLQIRLLAKRLLSLHIDEKKNEKQINEIIQALTVEFYSHLHAISRKEAKTILGDWVVPPSKAEEDAILNLFDAYAQTFDLRNKLCLPPYMGDEPNKDLCVNGALIESTELSHIYKTDLKISQRPNIPPNVQVQLPPGQAIPLVPWLKRSYEISIEKTGWQINSEGV
jgi:hypothetical protein